MNSCKRIGLVATVVMVVSVARLNVFGADDENEVLRGLKGVFVEAHICISGEPLEIKTLGITESQLLVDAELKLRTTGVKVLSEAEVLKTKGLPVLMIYVNLVEFWKLEGRGRIYGFSMDVELRQHVILKHNPAIEAHAPTWAKSVTGKIEDQNINELRNILTNDILPGFLNAWLSVNPKL